MNFKVLDCTLRDGGYINDWNFGCDHIKSIVKNLVQSGVDYVELGFLKRCQYDVHKTLFNRISELSPFVISQTKTQFLGMITYGQYDASEIPEREEGMIDGVRIIFKPGQYKEALEFCKKVNDKGFKIFVNPMHTYAYSDKELLYIVDCVNEMKAHGLSIVDTLGLMSVKQLLHIFRLMDYNLAPEVGICFHSHNNLQLSFSNAQVLIGERVDRELIIDASVRGMGRGAGNLCSELLLQYLNDNFEKNYNLVPILKIIDEQIDKIYAKMPWGYNVPYYLAASMRCHPNYSSFLMDKASISVESISEILAMIPDDKRSNYDEKLIQSLYLKYQKNEINDDALLDELHRAVQGSPILILAPGKSLTRETGKIKDYIEQEKPYIISINFRPANIRVDKVFISNARRFSEQCDLNNVIVTSNIRTNDVPKLNYGSYLNNSDMADNAALMLLKVLMKIGVNSVSFAGLDGFASDNDNYYAPEMINNARLGEETDRRNDIMVEMLHKFPIHIQFITATRYEN